MFRKLGIFCAFLFIFFMFSLPVSAFEFIKSPDNPLPISFISDYSQILQVHVYKDNGLYKGIATAKKTSQNYYSLIAIESVDGKSWNQIREILTSDDFDVSNSRLFIDRDGNRKILFAKMDSHDLYRLYSIDCDDNLNCSQTPSLLLDPNLSDYDENHGFFAPFIFDAGENYYLFYGAWGNNGFRLKVSYSSNLADWIKCPGEIITGGDGGFPYIDGDNLYLFIHRSNATGIQVLKTNNGLTCDSSWENLGYVIEKNQSYDQKHIVFPSLVNDGGQLKLYYSGLGNDNVWRLNLAETIQIPTVTPTPSPTPTPTPTETIVPTATPTQDKVPIILIPGFMASWNKDAILHNKTVEYQDWKLGPYVKEYRGLTQTLKNLGFEENEDLFIYAYDWRKKVNDSVDDLNQFIESKIGTGQKVNIVGHSLGGVIGRIYAQKYQDQNKVDKMVTVASPHYGVVQVYKPLEAGEIDRENTWLWLMEKIIINLNRGLFESDREVVEHMLPVTRDLFPTFNFLKNESGEFIEGNSLHISNLLLDFYNGEFNSVFPYFTALVGEKDFQSTLAGYKVTDPNFLDNLLSNYKDGRPVESFKSEGDYTVLTQSAKTDGDEFQALPLDHGEIIYKKVGIKKILEILGINYEESNITEGDQTVISPSLIFMMKSPATMTVTLEDKTYEEQDGIIFIENADSGNYELSVNGLDYGYYNIEVGQISETNDIWETIEGKIDQTPAASQADKYVISYNNETAYSINPSLTPTLTMTPALTPTPTPTQNPTTTATPAPTSTPVLQSTPNPTLIIYQSVLYPTDSTSSDILGVKSKYKNEIKKNKMSFPQVLYPLISVFIIAISWWYLRKKYQKN